MTETRLKSEYKLPLVIAAAVLGAFLIGNVSSGLFIAPIAGSQSLDDGWKMQGAVTYTLKDADGNIITQFTNDNLLVNTGEDILQEVFNNVTMTKGVKIICIGTGGGTAAAESGAGSTLVTPITGGVSDTCQTGTVTLNENGGVSQSVDIQATWTGATDVVAGTAVDESVLSDDAPPSEGTAPAGATTFARQTFTAITVNSADQLTIKWTVTISE